MKRSASDPRKREAVSAQMSPIDIQLQALVCSNDQRTIKILQILLADMRIGLDVCASQDEAGRHLTKRHFDGVFIDSGMEAWADLLGDVQLRPGSRRAVSFAILEGKTSVKEAFSFGASFVLYKPLSIERTKSSLRAAHGLMMRERRRQYRHSLKGVTAMLSFVGFPETQGEVLDLSHGGMSLRLMEGLERRGEVRVRFILPGSSRRIQVEGIVTWADNFGRVGVHFSVMPPASRTLLDEWLLKSSRAIIQEGRATAAQTAAKNAPPDPDPGPRTRQVLRAELGVGLTVVTIRNGEPYRLQAVCDDLTPDGLGAKVNGELFPGEPVLLHLSLPSLESMKVHADVRHRHGNHVGFDFVGLTREQRNELSDICELLPVAS